MWMSEVEMKVWIRGRSASCTAFQAASMSAMWVRASPAITGATGVPKSARAMACTASKSPGEVMGNPASITSTPSRASWVAISSFSCVLSEIPGDCSPSRRVVSKISTRSGSSGLVMGFSFCLGLGFFSLIPLMRAEEEGELRLRERRRALQLARENPELAREIGVGRPDRPGAVDAGVVDVNNASATVLLGLPGVDGDAVTQIIEGRGKVGGFSSLEDMGAALDLDGALVESLRDKVVFLPRAHSA